MLSTVTSPSGVLNRFYGAIHVMVRKTHSEAVVSRGGPEVILWEHKMTILLFILILVFYLQRKDISFIHI